MPRDRDSISLYVSGFKDSTRPSDLATLFEPHGRIVDVYLPKDYYTGAPRGFAYIQYMNEEDARRVYESGEQFILDGRKLGIQYAQGRRKSPNQMRSSGRDRRRSRSADRFYRPSSRRYSRSRSRSGDRRDRRRDSRSPVRRRYSRSRSRSRSRSPRGRSPSPGGRRASSRNRSYSPRRRSYSPRRRSPSPRDRRPSLKNDNAPYSPRGGQTNRRYTPSPDRVREMGNGTGQGQPFNQN